jgi:MFS family permease
VIGGILAYISAIIIILIGTRDIALWRWVVGISLILQIIFWVSSYFIFESPKFLARKGHDLKAASVLK